MLSLFFDWLYMTTHLVFEIVDKFMPVVEVLVYVLTGYAFGRLHGKFYN